MHSTLMVLKKVTYQTGKILLHNTILPHDFISDELGDTTSSSSVLTSGATGRTDTVDLAGR